MLRPHQPSSNAVNHAALFNALWAFYVLMHILKLTPWNDAAPMTLRIINGMLIASAISVLFRAKNPWLFLTLILLQLASVGIQLPGLSNCWLFSGFLAVGIVTSYCRLFWKLGARKLSVVDVYQSIAPMLRCSLIALYGFAVLAKLNAAFLSLDSSCGAFFCELICSAYGFENPPGWLLWSAIPGTLLAELAIPVLLTFRSTRSLGIVLGLAFHTFIAHSSKLLVFDFSALVLPLYVTFTSPDLIVVLQRSKNARLGRFVARNRKAIILALTSLAVIIIWKVSTGPGAIAGTLFRYRGGIWFSVGLFATAFAFFELYWKRTAVVNLTNPFSARTWPAVLALLLVVANGMAPYLGLKTGVAYTMFSNLRTESGYENHLFMPVALRVFPYQNESVLILASSEPKLQKLANANERLLLHDLRNRASKFPNASLRYEHAGQEYLTAKISKDPLIGKPLKAWESKLLFFRTIPQYNHRHQW